MARDVQGLDLPRFFGLPRPKVMAYTRVGGAVSGLGSGLRRYDSQKSPCRRVCRNEKPSGSTTYTTSTTLRREIASLTYACTHARAHMRECVFLCRTVVETDKSLKRKANRYDICHDRPKIGCRSVVTDLQAIEIVQFGGFLA